MMLIDETADLRGPMRGGVLASAVPEQYQSSQSLRVNEYTATAAFVTVVWDILITFGDEVTYIWPKPKTAYIKWLYLFGKYFTLVAQIGLYWFQMHFIAHNPLPSQWCRIYRGIEAAEIELLLLTFDFVLLRRIHALYGRKTPATIIGTCAMVLEGVAAVTGALLTFPGIVYDSACAVISFPNAVLVVAVGAFVCQATLLWLAYRKKEMVVRAERGQPSIGSTTIRDGVIAFVCIVAVFVIFAICQLTNSTYTNLAIYWFPVFTSIATSRIVMNIQQASPSYTEPTRIQLTTQIWDPEYELQSRSSESFLRDENSDT